MRCCGRRWRAPLAFPEDGGAGAGAHGSAIRKSASAAETKMAAQLVESMTTAFDPRSFHDTYREELLSLIEARAAGKATPERKTPAPKATHVVDLVSVLEKSLAA